LFASLLASAPTPAYERAAASGWLQLAPLGIAIPSPGADVRGLNRAVRSGFRWGFSAGASFEPVSHLFVSVSAGFEQKIWIFDNTAGYELCFGGDCYGWDERGLGHLLQIGPELRIGWMNHRVVTWALLAGQLGVSRIRLDCNNSVEEHCDRTETDLGPGIGGGLGFAIRVTPRAALGIEGSVEHAWLDRREDPFRAVRTVDLAMVLAVQF
jgi:hypothetical protein